MKQSHMPYIQAVARLSQDSVTKTQIVAAAVAVATAISLPLPSTPVESPEGYYASTCALLATGEVGEYNEEAVLDVPQALEMTRNFWLLRYNALHQTVLVPPTHGSFFMGFTGASRFFSHKDICLLNEYADEIFSIQLSIREIKRQKGTDNVVA